MCGIVGWQVLLEVDWNLIRTTDILRFELWHYFNIFYFEYYIQQSDSKILSS